MTMRNIFGPLLLVSSAAAIHTPPLSPQQHVEITGSSRIVRHELNEAASLAEVAGKNRPLELNPNLMGGASGPSASTTEIVPSGEGPTTTAIYAVGAAPKGGEAPNAIDLTPAPWTIKPGAPGPPGISGPPGPPGEPGPPEGQVATTTPAVKTNKTKAPLLGASANATKKPLDANTQSGYEIRGPKGAKGAKGRAGKQGARGSQGLQGMLGHRGTNGTAGEPGERGPPGARKFPHAPKISMMWVALGINLFVAFAVFIMSYLEFVSEKKPIPYLFGGDCCSAKCGTTGDRFNGCFYRLSCGICCRPYSPHKAAGEWEGEGYGEEQYGGYEQEH